MGIEEFTKEIAERLQARMDGVNVTPMDNLKNNGVVAHGLLFRRDDEKVAPTLYVEQLYDLFKRDRLSVDAILERIIRTYQELPAPNIPDMEEYLSSLELINKINIRLLNLNRNLRMITERNLVAYRIKNSDMVCLFYITVSNDGDTIGEIALSKTLMELYLPEYKTAEDLYNAVVSKVPSEVISLEPVAKFANQIIKERGFCMPPIPIEANFLYVLTNNARMHGASVILTEAGKKLIRERFPNGKLTVLPSSIHETLILETAENESVEWLQEMVREVNATQLDAVDYLSDNIYHLDVNTGELVKATVDESEVEEE